MSTHYYTINGNSNPVRRPSEPEITDRWLQAHYSVELERKSLPKPKRYSLIDKLGEHFGFNIREFLEDEDGTIGEVSAHVMKQALCQLIPDDIAVDRSKKVKFIVAYKRYHLYDTGYNSCFNLLLEETELVPETNAQVLTRLRKIEQKKRADAKERIKKEEEDRKQRAKLAKAAELEMAKMAKMAKAAKKEEERLAKLKPAPLVQAKIKTVIPAPVVAPKEIVRKKKIIAGPDWDAFGREWDKAKGKPLSKATIAAIRKLNPGGTVIPAKLKKIVAELDTPKKLAKPVKYFKDSDKLSILKTAKEARDRKARTTTTLPRIATRTR